MQRWIETDLAVEVQEQCSGDQGEIPGVVLKKYKEQCGIEVTRIEILNREGEKQMGKPVGVYLTLELGNRRNCVLNSRGQESLDDQRRREEGLEKTKAERKMQGEEKTKAERKTQEEEKTQEGEKTQGEEKTKAEKKTQGEKMKEEEKTKEKEKMKAEEKPQEDGEYESCMRVLAGQIRMLMPKQVRTVLVAGLGNKNMTADALGPRTVEQLTTTRLTGGSDEGIAAIVPGVLAQTGMESSEIIRGIIDKIHPDCLIAVDALAARSAYRVGTTIQLTNTGICPGSGVGNKRSAMNYSTMGIPVIAIGVPTVVSAAAIVSDAMEALKETYDRKTGYRETILGSVALLEKEEYYQLISEVMTPRIGSFFVMPKDLDDTITDMSALLAGALELIAP